MHKEEPKRLIAGEMSVEAGIRALGLTSTILRDTYREKGDLARLAISVEGELLKRGLDMTTRGTPITQQKIMKILSKMRGKAVKPRKANGHGKTPFVSTREALQRLAAEVPQPEGDTIDAAINDLLGAVARVEGFVKAAKLDAEKLAALRRELL